MATKKSLEALDRTVQDICNHNQIMGGITTILCGDFRQTLPVIPRGTRVEEIEACLKSSYIWPYVKVFSLKTNMRIVKSNANQNNCSDFLLPIGDGTNENVNLFTYLSEHNIVQNLNSLIQNIYPAIQNLKTKTAKWFCERTILTSKNDRADYINDLVLELELVARQKSSTNQLI